MFVLFYGIEGADTEYLKFSIIKRHVFLSLCFTLSLAHGHLPPTMYATTIVPIVKYESVILSDSNSYRPIELATIKSAYQCGHSTETALLRVYNDIYVTIGKGNGNFLVLLDLSSAFDTIDHSILFTVLGKHVGICDDAMNLIVSYLSDRKQ